jgi:DNA-binding NarL/FixJ family response regulator
MTANRIDKAAASVIAISAQQYSAVELLHRAMTQDEIAEVLEITPRTVAHHLREARRHTGARNGVALALMFERGQIVVKRTREAA